MTKRAPMIHSREVTAKGDDGSAVVLADILPSGQESEGNYHPIVFVFSKKGKKENRTVYVREEQVSSVAQWLVHPEKCTLFEPPDGGERKFVINCYERAEGSGDFILAIKYRATKELCLKILEVTGLARNELTELRETVEAERGRRQAEKKTTRAGGETGRPDSAEPKSGIYGSVRNWMKRR